MISYILSVQNNYTVFGFQCVNHELNISNFIKRLVRIGVWSDFFHTYDSMNIKKTFDQKSDGKTLYSQRIKKFKINFKIVEWWISF